MHSALQENKQGKKHAYVFSKDFCSSHGLCEQWWLFTGQGAVGGDVSL